MKYRLLIVDSDASLAQRVAAFLSEHDFVVDTANKPGQARERLENASYSAVISDRRLSPNAEDEGLLLLREVMNHHPGTARLLYMHGDAVRARELVGDVANRIVDKRWPLDALSAALIELVQDRAQQRVLGGYRLLDEIGIGSIGTIWRAQDLENDQIVAVKELHRNLAAQPTFVKRFMREIEVTQALWHENIVRVENAGEDNGVYFLALEYVDGYDLEVAISLVDRLLPPIALSIVRDVLQGLEFAHKQNIIHRDIKPANILIDASGRAKIADFSIAKAKEVADVTTTGSVFGTPPYMSPEQINGQGVDGRTDLFSLSVVLYEMLAGGRPFDGPTYPLTISKLLHSTPPLVSQINPWVPPALARWVSTGLEKNPRERYATAAEALAALDSLAQDEGYLISHEVVADFIKDPEATQSRVAIGHARRWLRRSQREEANDPAAAMVWAERAALWTSHFPETVAEDAEIIPRLPAQEGERLRPHRDTLMSFEVVVEIKGESKARELMANDISPSGAFLECEDPPEPGTQITVLLPVTMNRVLKVEADVIRSVSIDDAIRTAGVPGIGVEFKQLSDDAWRLVQRAARNQLARSSGSVPGIVLAKQEPPSSEMVDRLLRSARAAIGKKLFVKATRDLELALKCDPTNEEIGMLLKDTRRRAAKVKAELLFRQGEFLEQAYERERQKRPVAAARSLEAMYRCYRDAARLCPGDVSYIVRCAQAAFLLGDHDATEAHATIGLELDPDHAPLLALRARARFQSKREDALEDIERALEIDGDNEDYKVLRRQIRRRKWSVSGLFVILTKKK